MADRFEPHGSDDRTDHPWGLDDDDFLRAALMTLGDDVDANPLPEPAWVRAQARRNSRRRAAVWAAGIAAAAVAVAAVGFTAVGRNAALERPLPGHSSTAPTLPSPTATPSASAAPVVLTDTAGALPVAAEWQAALAMRRSPTVEDQPSADTVGGACRLGFGDAELTGYQRVVRDPARPDETLLATQTRVTYSSLNAAAGAARQLDQAARSCDTQIGIATAGRDIAVLELAGPSTIPGTGLDQLLDVATERLIRYGTPDSTGRPSATPVSTGSATPSPERPATSSSSPVATQEQCGAVDHGLSTKGVNAKQAEKARIILSALLGCDSTTLVDIATTDGTALVGEGGSAQAEFSLPANRDRYIKGAIALSLTPGNEGGYARWPAYPTTDAAWNALVTAGLLTETEKDQLRAGGESAGWGIVIDENGRMTAFTGGG